MAASPQVPIWERDDPGQRAPVQPLRRDDVVRAAVALADADGLSAVSVRRVAAALDVGPMRLYRVFATIEELNELMVDAVYGEIVEGLRPRGEWQARTREIMSRARSVILAHEWAGDLLGARPPVGPKGLTWLELLANALTGAPAASTPGDTWSAMGVLSGFLIGTVRREIADRRAGRAGDGKTEWRTQLAPYLSRQLDTGRFPALRVLILARPDAAPDTAFHNELAIVLAGLNTSAPG